jgi:hypothetical protein
MRFFYALASSTSAYSCHGLNVNAILISDEDIIKAAFDEACREGVSLESLAGLKAIEHENGYVSYERELTDEDRLRVSIEKLGDDGRLFEVYAANQPDELEKFVRQARHYGIEEDALALMRGEETASRLIVARSKEIIESQSDDWSFDLEDFLERSKADHEVVCKKNIVIDRPSLPAVFTMTRAALIVEGVPIYQRNRVDAFWFLSGMTFKPDMIEGYGWDGIHFDSIRVFPDYSDPMLFRHHGFPGIESLEYTPPEPVIPKPDPNGAWGLVMASTYPVKMEPDIRFATFEDAARALVLYSRDTCIMEYGINKQKYRNELFGTVVALQDGRWVHEPRALARINPKHHLLQGAWRIAP